MIFIKDKAKVVVMNRYFLMFMFGVMFVILEAIQRLFVRSFWYYVLLFLELGGVYFIIKNFAKREIGNENSKRIPKIK